MKKFLAVLLTLAALCGAGMVFASAQSIPVPFNQCTALYASDSMTGFANPPVVFTFPYHNRMLVRFNTRVSYGFRQDMSKGKAPDNWKGDIPAAINAAISAAGVLTGTAQLPPGVVANYYYIRLIDYQNSAYQTRLIRNGAFTDVWVPSNIKSIQVYSWYSGDPNKGRFPGGVGIEILVH